VFVLHFNSLEMCLYLWSDEEKENWEKVNSKFCEHHVYSRNYEFDLKLILNLKFYLLFFNFLIFKVNLIKILISVRAFTQEIGSPKHSLN